MGGPQPTVKSFEIDKRLVYVAWEKVRANLGAPGVDAVRITDFAVQQRNNLYKLWNRMSAGSYLPGPVRAVEIPKDHGAGIRVLGVPNVADRIAQTAAAMLLEEKLEPIFHPDSYGYRPGRSGHDALAVTRKRCWRQAWVVDLDIRAFFDSVPHDLLLKAVAHHTDERWVLLYIARWLTAPMQMPDGTMVAREKGTPQGSPISPLLANLFMHDGIQDGSWPLVECLHSFDRTAWPSPVFGNPGAGYRSVRDEEAPRHEAAVLAAEPGDEDLPSDGYAGSVYMERVLDLRPTGDERRPRIIPATSVTLATASSPSSADDEAVLLHFSVPTTGVRRWESRVQALEDQLTALVEESGVGEFDGIERDGQAVVFFLYGPDKERLWKALEPVLRSSKVPLAHALLRAGGPEVTPTRLTL